MSADTKTIVRITLIILLCAYTAFQTIKGIKAAFFSKKVTECGTVAWKDKTIYTHKSSSRVEYIMVVNYDKIGRKDVDVTASTWSNYKVGERICFDYDVKEFSKGFMGIVDGLFAIVGCIVLAFFLVYVLVCSITWLCIGKFVFIDD